MRETDSDTITIRRSSSTDRSALERLAGRDSQALADDDYLIAEVTDEMWAAFGIRTGLLMADPFRPSGEVAELLRMRAAHARDGAPVARSVPPLRRLLARRAVT
jgi:hypothetical protein